MLNFKKIFRPILTLMAFLTLAGAVYAAIDENVKSTGLSFSVGSDFSGGGTGGTTSNANLKLLANTSIAATGTNLVDTVTGPSFENINNVWTDDFSLKVFNKGTTTLALTASADYISDLNTLRDDIFVEIIEWNDTNNNGLVENGEEGNSYGNNTILRLRNDTFILGDLGPSQTRGFIYRFNGSGLTSSNAGQSAIYDFPIRGIAQ